MICGEHGMEGYEPERNLVIRCFLPDFVETEPGKSAETIGGSRYCGSAKSGITSASRVGITSISTIRGGAWLPQVIAAIRLYQSDPRRRPNVHPVIGAEPVGVHLVLVDMPDQQPLLLVAHSVRGVHLGCIALLSLTILEQVELVSTRNGQVENGIGGGHRPQTDLPSRG